VVTSAQAAKEIFTVLVNYYPRINDPPPPIPRSFKENLPQFGKITKTVTNISSTVYTKTWAAWLYHGTLGVLQISRDDVVQFFTGSLFSNLLQNKCNS